MCRSPSSTRPPSDPEGWHRRRLGLGVLDRHADSAQSAPANGSHRTGVRVVGENVSTPPWRSATGRSSSRLQGIRRTFGGGSVVRPRITPRGVRNGAAGRIRFPSEGLSTQPAPHARHFVFLATHLLGVSSAAQRQSSPTGPEHSDGNGTIPIPCETSAASQVRFREFAALVTWANPQKCCAQSWCITVAVSHFRDWTWSAKTVRPGYPRLMAIVAAAVFGGIGACRRPAAVGCVIALTFRTWRRTLAPIAASTAPPVLSGRRRSSA